MKNSAKRDSGRKNRNLEMKASINSIKSSMESITIDETGKRKNVRD
jgi:hypothetical protein